MLFLPNDLPCSQTLTAEGAVVREYSKTCFQNGAEASAAFPEGAKKILFLNLMPQKAVTELDIARMMAATGEDVVLIPMKIAGQTYKTTPMEHMERFYVDFETLKPLPYDGLIITGAPVEHLPFEQVRYWPQLCRIIDWARAGGASSTLYICWGAQAGLYYNYGIAKHSLPAKRFGIFRHEVSAALATPQLQALLSGLAPTFPMPHSRHTEVRAADFATHPLRLLALSHESGVGLAATADGREVYVTGHLEYEPHTLENEYRRDVAKGLPIHIPEHYYQDDNPSAGILFSWAEAAKCFYRNWVRLCHR